MADSRKLTPEGRNYLDQVLKRKGWTRCSLAQSANISLSTSNRFFRNQAIKTENIEAMGNSLGIDSEELINRYTTLSHSPIKLNWNRAPVSSPFYGRTNELTELTQWINGDRCRVVAIHGAQGAGKTALVIKLVEQIESDFDYLIWFQLRSTPPSLEIFLSEILELLYNNSNSEPPQNGQNVSDRIFELMNFFHEKRCLLLLDGMEKILSSGDYAGCYQDKYRNYGELFRTMIQEQHQSCLIVTSREITEEIAISQGEDQPVRSYRLQGLGEEAAREILKAKKLSGEDSFKDLIENYQGNPVKLRIVSTYIKQMYNGNVANFIRQRTTLVPKSMYEFLDPQYNCLSEVEKNILAQLAKQQEPVSLSQLQEILSFSSITVNKAIESLKERDFIEEDITALTLVQVVKEYVLEKLKPKED